MHARHYESAGANEVRQRLEALYDHLLDALRSRDLGPIVSYAEQVAEVQTAFNALEEAYGPASSPSCSRRSSQRRWGWSARSLEPPKTRSRATTSGSPPRPRSVVVAASWAVVMALAPVLQIQASVPARSVLRGTSVGLRRRDPRKIGLR
jgi:hypothetical protein